MAEKEGKQQIKINFVSFEVLKKLNDIGPEIARQICRARRITNNKLVKENWALYNIWDKKKKKEMGKSEGKIPSSNRCKKGPTQIQAQNRPHLIIDPYVKEQRKEMKKGEERKKKKREGKIPLVTDIKQALPSTGPKQAKATAGIALYVKKKKQKKKEKHVMGK